MRNIFVPMLLFTAMGLCTVSCRHRHTASTPAPPSFRVKRVAFDGIHHFKSSELIPYLQIRRKSMWWKLDVGDTSVWVYGRLKDDKEKLEALYRTAGYFDAAISIRVDEVDDEDIVITYVVSEGAPARVRTLDIKWDIRPDDAANVETLARPLVGEPADIAVLNQSKEKMLSALRNDGFALAAVETSIEIWPEQKAAAVHIALSPGPACRIGTITLNGLSQIREEYVFREVDTFKGQLFTPSVRKEMEGRLNDMGVFAVVSVSHADTLNDRGRLDLSIFLVERELQSMMLKLGLAMEPDKQALSVTHVYKHTNLFHRLFGLDLKTSAGYAALPYVWKMESHGPVASVEPKLTKKGLLEKNLVWALGTRFGTDLTEDYHYLETTTRLSVSRFFFKKTVLTLAYNFIYIFVYRADDRWLAALESINPNIQMDYFGANVETAYRIFLTDTPIDPKNGAVVELKYAISAHSLGADAQYHRLNPSLSLYWQIVPRLQLATRAEVGFLFPFGETTGTGWWDNFSIGGYNTIRGWGGKKLSPWTEVCWAANDCEKIRVGGRTMVLGNVELRVNIWRDLYGVTFMDIGDVQYDVFHFAPGQWNYTAGAGFRYATPVGKVRLDFGYRVTDPEAYRHEPRFAMHVGLGESF